MRDLIAELVVLGNSNLSEIIRFAEVLKGLANPMLSILCLFLSTMFSVFPSPRYFLAPPCLPEAHRGAT
jgi:hypothetical protein